LKHTRKHQRSRKESNQGTKLPASGGLSGQAGRTVRKGRADCPVGYRGLSAPLPRTIRPESRIVRGEHANCPPGTRGPSAQHTRTVRNFAQSKLENTADRKRSRARTRRTRDEHARCGPSARSTQTVREARTEQKTARPRRSTPPIHHRISQTVEAVETRVGDKLSVQQGCYTPKLCLLTP
jgi:hypothetical protein